MNKAKLLLTVGILALAGCTDTMDSISREYRNANNEIIDAMMMITSEARAVQMNTVFFKTGAARYKKLDDKLKIFQINQATNKEWVLSVFESEGVVLYFAEMDVNQKRFDLELERLKKLHKQLVDEEKASQGDDVDPKKVAPTIYGIITSQDFEGLNHPLRGFRRQLGKKEEEKDKDGNFIRDKDGKIKTQVFVSALGAKMDQFIGLKGVTRQEAGPPPKNEIKIVPEKWYVDSKQMFDEKVRAKIEQGR